MAIAEPLTAGLEAYRRGDYSQALLAWETPWQRLAGEDEALCLALVRLAGALHHAAGDRGESARRLLAGAREALAGLPPVVLGMDVERLRGQLQAPPEALLQSPPELLPGRRLGTASALRFAAFLALLLAGAAVLRWTPVGEILDRERLVSSLQALRTLWWTPLALIAAMVVAAPLGVPMTPFVIANGVVFGTLLGSTYNGLGTFLGAATSYLLATYLGRDFVVRLAGDRLRRVESLLRRHGFWSLVGIRFLPLPFPVVNFGAALAGVPLGTFLATTAIGLIPALFVYTWFAATLFQVATGSADASQVPRVVAAMLLVMSLALMPAVWRQVARRRRYRRLMARRAARRQ
ncbi:MAG TPA: VTT domain-containing protein [Thermoanaerobaculia bacterium]|nr:VTT domain-containing protein [Thermoanaerobaculia bacterium]